MYIKKTAKPHCFKFHVIVQLAVIFFFLSETYCISCVIQNVNNENGLCKFIDKHFLKIHVYRRICSKHAC